MFILNLIIRAIRYLAVYGFFISILYLLISAIEYYIFSMNLENIILQGINLIISLIIVCHFITVIF
ncbi:hypothetical protein [Fusobacterium polymorphum]|uniref:hypothetical protein n=1 Tax=Fusobacterium nucleatum subsp. polymorphum TaxID=76857 RepID=UPI003009FB6C